MSEDMMDKDTDRHNGVVSELILAAVPLGNIGDASDRLKRAITEADVVAAEDSRRFLRLCKREMKALALMKFRQRLHQVNTCYS
jgi:16S rRNA C1402 (ribose-2'-O) methylase RsmI